MDPITTAIIAGAAAAIKDEAKDAVKAAYKGLKTSVTHWFAKKPEAQAALAKIEANHEDPAARTALAEAVAQLSTETEPDAPVLKSAAEMRSAIEKHGTADEKKRYFAIMEEVEADEINLTGGGKVSKDLDAQHLMKKVKAGTLNIGGDPAKKA